MLQQQINAEGDDFDCFESVSKFFKKITIFFLFQNYVASNCIVSKKAIKRGDAFQTAHENGWFF